MTVDAKERWSWAFETLGGLGAWTVQLVLASIIGEATCVREGTLFTGFGANASFWSLLILTLACLAVAGAAAVQSLRHWLRLKSQGYEWDSVAADLQDGTSAARNSPAKPGEPFLAATSTVLNLLLVYIIAAQGLPIFYLGGDC